MTIRLQSDAIVMEGRCGVDEVEPLLVAVDANPDLPLDIAGAITLHTAIWQLILARRLAVRGVPDTPYARDMLVPAIHRWLDAG